jgi:hypothetical protein
MTAKAVARKSLNARMNEQHQPAQPLVQVLGDKGDARLPPAKSTAEYCDVPLSVMRDDEECSSPHLSRRATSEGPPGL